MKKRIIGFVIVFIIFAFEYVDTFGINIISNLKDEKISFFTDRTLYISGEQIQFVVYLFMNEPNTDISISGIKSIDELESLLKNQKSQKKYQQTFSSTIYVELITPEGEKIVGGKYLYDNTCGAGCITIPNDIVSGIYYVRAYTKFLRNNGPSRYFYIPIKVVNPAKKEILSYKYESIRNDSTKNNETEIVGITLDKSQYLTKDNVSIRLKNSNIKETTIRGMNITVIPSSSIIYNNPVYPQRSNAIENQYYYPETNGITLTGKLKDSKSEKPIPNTIVNLSILGNHKDFMAIKTDSDGRFFFKMPDFKGVNDVFLSTETNADSKSTILIDNEFCQSKISIPTPMFSLNESEKKIVFDMAQNIQVASYFNKKNIPTTTPTINNKPFYNEPQSRLVLDNYVQLPTVEDYINELIPILFIKKQQGKKYFKIYSSQAEMNIYNPLVLLDMVAIDNPEKILSLSPQKIDRIEVVNAAYVKGDITYGGIISIFSKKGDFAGIDLPSSGLFLDFNFWSDCENISNCQPTLKNQPDTRNTLLWEPQVSLNTDGTKEISFNTSDTPGDYIVLVRGITKDGKEFSYEKPFTVKEKE